MKARHIGLLISLVVGIAFGGACKKKTPDNDPPRYTWSGDIPTNPVCNWNTGTCISADSKEYHCVMQENMGGDGCGTGRYKVACVQVPVTYRDPPTPVSRDHAE